MAYELEPDFEIEAIQLEQPVVEDSEINLNFETFQQVTTSDHNQLQNRKMADQHPIGAITGLEKKLEEKAEGEAITNAEIDSIWKTIIGG